MPHIEFGQPSALHVFAQHGLVASRQPSANFIDERRPELQLGRQQGVFLLACWLPSLGHCHRPLQDITQHRLLLEDQ